MGRVDEPPSIKWTAVAHGRRMSIGASGVDRQATDTVPQSGFYGDCRANKADVFVLAGADGRACQK